MQLFFFFFPPTLAKPGVFQWGSVDERQKFHYNMKYETPQTTLFTSAWESAYIWSTV